jgi:UDP-N-acetylmuramoyl-tripeptide--D-alanyl-D-alanine ligase
VTGSRAEPAVKARLTSSVANLGARPATRAVDFAVRAMRGTLLRVSSPDAVFAGASFDSRYVRAGEMFFALPGENVDGYDYCVSATAAGAAALVVDIRRGCPSGLLGPDGGATAVPVIGVDDPLAALADLARAIRSDFSGRVVGITGSNGKTTTRALTAAALAASGRVLQTQGNYNTEIGLPLTIIGASGDEDFWVLEMAMRGRGQIALLADIARPHVGVITNVAGAHLGLLGSIEEVARAKGELFAALQDNAGDGGIAVLPGGDALIEAQAAHLPDGRKLRFDGGVVAPPTGLDVIILESLPAGVAGQIVRYAVRRQPVVARLPLPGLHNARNGAAALAVAAALQVPIPDAARALSRTVLPPHRSLPITVAGRIILDDCYNANPDSMRAALAALVESTARFGGRPFAILGDMLELGPDTHELHRAIGREAGIRLAGLGAIGELGAEIAGGARDVGLDAGCVTCNNDPKAVAAEVASWSRRGDWILVKASRGMRLERVVDALVEEFRMQAPIA